MTKLFLDSDGVFADFDQHVMNHFGKGPRELGDQTLWKMVNSDPHRFWDDMPIKDDAHELWEFAKNHDPIVLTGCPRTGYDIAADAKRKWWKTHFGWDSVITCLSRDKAKHMLSVGDVLVDDFIRNIRRWEDAGGIGIYHKSTTSTLKKLVPHFG